MADDIEQVWFNIHIKNKKNITVGVVYRPHNNVSGFLDRFENALSLIMPSSDAIFCLGDFNIDALNSASAAYCNFCALLEVFSLKQYIDEPTRINLRTSTLIDFVIADDGAPVVASGAVAVHDISDHHLVFCTIALTNFFPPSVVRTFRSFRNIDSELFMSDLKEVQWHSIFDFNDIDAKLNFLNNNIVNLFDRHAPIVTHTFTKKNHLG